MILLFIHDNNFSKYYSINIVINNIVIIILLHFNILSKIYQMFFLYILFDHINQSRGEILKRHFTIVMLIIIIIIFMIILFSILFIVIFHIIILLCLILYIINIKIIINGT